MATYGKIEYFSGNKEEWEVYIERLEVYFTANDLDEILLATDSSNANAVKRRNEKRRAILLSVIGPTTYTLLRNLVSPNKPTEKSYDELVSALRNHYQPTTSITVQRYKFHTRSRKTNESVPDYVSELKKLAEKCDFKDTLNDMLKDRLVAGINDEKIQKRLLIETDLTFEKAYNISVTQELANQDAHVLQIPTGSVPVNKVGCYPKKNSDKPSHTHRAQPSSFGTNKQGNKQCFRCGDKSHTAPKCKFINAKCHYCSKVGHIEKVCLSKQRHKHTKKEKHEDTNAIEAEPDTDQNPHDLFNIQSDSVTPPLHVDVIVDDVQMKFQLDTGAGVSLINQTDFVRHFGNTQLDPPSVKLRSYTGEKLTVVGERLVNVVVGDQSAKLPLKVVGGNGPPLFGRDWLQEIRVPWKKILNVEIVNKPPEVEGLLAEYGELFSSELGCLQGIEAHIEIEEGATPQFCKARPLPFAMKNKVEHALQKLESQGVIEKVVHSDWAAPVVPVVKANGDARLCGDYKVTVNKVAKQDKYPLPLVDEIFASLSHGEKFTKLDLSQAYHQIPLDEASQQLTTINTHVGLFKYKRLPYGVSCAVGLFQRTMENLLKGLPSVSVYIDDILVTGRDDTEHLANLRGVLTRLQENGLRLQMTKCQFMLPEVEYLGFKITKDGIKPTESKVRTIKEAPAPTNVNELRTFIGLVNYYARFLPNLAHHMAPLYKLLRKDETWSWKGEQQSSFQKIKKMMSEDVMLAHYDPDAELVLSCDASSYGIGAVLQQLGPNGELKPVHFASRSLTSAEKNYAQIEREALGIVYGVQKFRQYLLGRSFTLETDHQPLVKLFGEHTAIPQLAAARIKRWALILSAYSYKVKYISSKENACADYLSRAPLQEPPDLPDVSEQEDVLLIDEELLRQLPLTARTVASETQKDPCLAKVLQLTREGWPSKCDDDKLQPYFLRKTELTVEQGCVLWGSRVVIPSTLRPTLLLDLHSEHTGTVRMKGLARQYFWWPKMNDEIEQIAKNCASCQETASAPPSPPVAKWNWPSGPWKRLHIDYAGPYMGSMFLVVIDSYSKWLEVIPMKSTTTVATIRQLRKVFSNFGLPEHLVSDNGPQFSSSEFKEFLMKNNIRHTLTPPGHPASNGMAERYVRYFKSQLKKMEKDEGTLQEKICRILLTYRCTPHPATSECPAYLLMRRQLRTRFSSLRPSLDSQKDADSFEQNTSCAPKFAVGDKVYVLNLRAGPRWLPGIVIEVLQRSYYVHVDGQPVWKRHEDQLRPRSMQCKNEDSIPTPPTVVPLLERPPSKASSGTASQRPPESLSDAEEPVSDTLKTNAEIKLQTPQVNPQFAAATPKSTEHKTTVATAPTAPVPRRNPPRERKPPSRYGWE